MDKQSKAEIARSVADFALPRYEAIPDMGLYLEQTARYVSGYLACLGDMGLTGSMISNYVKKGLVDNPVKKRYYRDQIAYLIFIAAAKSVVSIEDLKLFIQLQKRTCPTQKAYDYFCSELENVLQHIFGLKQTLDTVGSDTTDEKFMLRNTIITVAHKVYLDKHFQQLHRETE